MSWSQTKASTAPNSNTRMWGEQGVNRSYRCVQGSTMGPYHTSQALVKYWNLLVVQATASFCDSSHEGTSSGLPGSSTGPYVPPGRGASPEEP